MTQSAVEDQAQELATVLRGLQRRLTVLDENDPTIGLPIAQLRVCGILQDGPLPVCTVSRELGMSASAVTQIANRLQRAGMVERIPRPEDRRVRGLSLTAHGREAMQARRQRRVERIQAALGGIAPSRRGEILDAMRDLLAAAEARPAVGNGESGVGETISDLRFQISEEKQAAESAEDSG